jgi:hypothetical protein
MSGGNSGAIAQTRLSVVAGTRESHPVASILAQDTHCLSSKSFQDETGGRPRARGSYHLGGPVALNPLTFLATRWLQSLPKSPSIRPAKGQGECPLGLQGSGKPLRVESVLDGCQKKAVLYGEGGRSHEKVLGSGLWRLLPPNPAFGALGKYPGSGPCLTPVVPSLGYGDSPQGAQVQGTEPTVLVVSLVG